MLEIYQTNALGTHFCNYFENKIKPVAIQSVRFSFESCNTIDLVSTWDKAEEDAIAIADYRAVDFIFFI